MTLVLERLEIWNKLFSFLGKTKYHMKLLTEAKTNNNDNIASLAWLRHSNQNWFQHQHSAVELCCSPHPICCWDPSSQLSCCFCSAARHLANLDTRSPFVIILLFHSDKQGKKQKPIHGTRSIFWWCIQSFTQKICAKYYDQSPPFVPDLPTRTLNWVATFSVNGSSRLGLNCLDCSSSLWGWPAAALPLTSVFLPLSLPTFFQHNRSPNSLCWFVFPHLLFESKCF